MKQYVVGITGASGVVYGIRLVQMLAVSAKQIHVVISESARLVLKEEMQYALKSYHRPSDMEALFGEETAQRVTAYSPKDFTAPIASGSYPHDGMIIAPCSMGTLGAVAGGLSQNLIHRAADCTLKEGRPLVLVPRETPLTAIHLENMAKLARLGVRIVPAMPGFYSNAKSIEDIVDFMVGKVLDQLHISHALYPRWTGSLKPSAEPRSCAHES